jgi:hypothetical protein
MNEDPGSRTILEVLGSEEGSIRNISSLLPVDRALLSKRLVPSWYIILPFM